MTPPQRVARRAPRRRHQVVRHAARPGRRLVRRAARLRLLILGRSGTGKSVTLRHIVGLITPGPRQGVRRRRRDQRAVGTGAVAGAADDRLPLSERRALRFDQRRRERGVSAAPAHPAVGSRNPRTGAREARGGRARERIRQDAGRALGRHAQARRPGAGDGARSADSARRRAAAPASIRSPPTRSTSCCSI